MLGFMSSTDVSLIVMLSMFLIGSCLKFPLNVPTST